MKYVYLFASYMAVFNLGIFVAYTLPNSKFIIESNNWFFTIILGIGMFMCFVFEND
jgi:hypothetical protein